ncbi:MAG: methionyl-tRNA formyltransferase [Treponema sp.]|jgi:methionyl-tRNA formyltransferase|nr:methionyl-tRNA formyltransferase [Treponema sp.]
MRILFAGSPGIAVPALEAVFELALRGEGFELAGVLTNPDSARGRRGTPEPSEIAACAERLFQSRAAGGGPVTILKPEKLDAAAREQTAGLNPDILISFAYGTIFGPRFLALFPLGGINIHPSLLPQYRGPTPIPAAILARDRETGISIQRLAPEMDSGDILLRETVPLNGRETTASLSAVMARKAAALLPGVLRGLAAGTLQAEPQNHSEATFCSLFTKETGRIDWNHSAAAIDAQIRAYTPWPLSWTTHNGEQLFILEAKPLETEPGNGTPPAPPGFPGHILGTDKQKGIIIQTGAGALAVTALQYRARKPLEWRAFLNGARNFTGTRLG